MGSIHNLELYYDDIVMAGNKSPKSEVENAIKAMKKEGYRKKIFRKPLIFPRYSQTENKIK